MIYQGIGLIGADRKALAKVEYEFEITRRPNRKPRLARTVG